MTQNQFMMAQLETQRQRDFRNWQEERRHNMAGEAENSLHNRNVENFNQLSLNESTRHNLAVESNEAAKNELTRLHYERQDEINRMLATETSRHDKTTETTEQLKAMNSYNLGLLEQANQNRRTAIEQQNADINERRAKDQAEYWWKSNEVAARRNEIANYDAQTRRKQFWLQTGSTVFNSLKSIVDTATISPEDALKLISLDIGG